MDYSKLRDLEINGYVLHRLNQGQSTRQQQLSVASGEVDYCNNPADAWPIILKNKISILIDETADYWSAASVQDYCDDGAFKHGTAHENPLRAAMIVYLMMQEGK